MNPLDLDDQQLKKCHPLSPTRLATFHHNRCDLYLFLSYWHANQNNSRQMPKQNELNEATFRKGYKWENAIRDRIDAQAKLVRMPPISSKKVHSVAQMLSAALSDCKSECFLVGLTMQSPKFNNRWPSGTEPVRFSTFAPDFVKFTVSQHESKVTIRWRIIDAKMSTHVKVQHQFQVGFYWLAVSELIEEFVRNQSEAVDVIRTTLRCDIQSVGITESLSDEWHGMHAIILPEDEAEIWIPLNGQIADGIPDPNGIVPLPALESLLKEFLFQQLPDLLKSNIEDIPWHYYSICSSCNFQQRCRSETETKRTISMIPNLSVTDAKMLRSVKRLPGIVASGSTTDIEDLASILHSDVKMNTMKQMYPSTYIRFRSVLDVPAHSKESPYLKSVTTSTVQMLHSPCLTFPRSEDIGVFLSVLVDPESAAVFGYFALAIDQHSGNTLHQTKFLANRDSLSLGELEASIVYDLAALLRKLQELNASRGSFARVQFYVFDESEKHALVNLLVDMACSRPTESFDEDDDLSLCIAGLLDDSQVLLTVVQPSLIDVGKLFGDSKGKMKKAKLQQFVKLFCAMLGVEVDVSGTVEQLFARLKDLIRQSSGRNPSWKLPRISCMRKAVQDLVCIPVPGYFGIEDCARWLLDSKDVKDISLAGIFELWTTAQNESAEDALIARTRLTADVAKDLRRRVQSTVEQKNLKLSDILINDAPVFDPIVLNVCTNPHLRKLLFMTQYEVITKMENIVQARCRSTRQIELSYDRFGKEQYTYVFKVRQGLAYVEETEFFDFLLVRDVPGNIVFPALFFDDLSFCSTFKFQLQHRDDSLQVIREHVAFANVVNVDRQANEVTLQVRYTKGWFRFPRAGEVFRLFERYVDFNLSKVVRSLLETQIESTNATQPVFVKFVSTGHVFNARPPFDKTPLVKEEKQMYRAYKHWRSLETTPNIALLHFMPSQRKAFQSFIERTTTVIRGPPGHGKTHTLALCALRMIELKARTSSRHDPCRIIVTALTHAAIGNFVAKFDTLLSAAREVKDMPDGEWRDEVRRVMLKNADEKVDAETKYLVVAGTVWGIYKMLADKPDMAGTFDCLLIDEASQLPLAESSIAMRALNNEDGRGRIVICGDDKQLGPILSATYPQNRDALQPALFGSVLECALWDVGRSNGDELGDLSEKMGGFTLAGDKGGKALAQPIVLKENFRMVNSLCDFSAILYGGGFGVASSKRNTQLCKDVSRSITNGLERYIPTVQHRRRASLQSTRPPEWDLEEKAWTVLSQIPIGKEKLRSLLTVELGAPKSDTWSYDEHLAHEATAIASLVNALRTCFDDERKMIVVAPHRAQRAEIERALQAGGESEKQQRVDTVEKIQGDEADIVIVAYGFTFNSQVDNELKFIFNRSRINVALTRARALCILIASSAVIQPSMHVLGDPGQRDAFALLSNFVERSHRVQWSSA
ncbi:hypothetical protein BJ742DRAFT_31731 [Cladochytrium replicatum]|nr:hypothetical protein BJ742DRAFT_31731 [Cladochytrium replicatum]